MEKLFVKNRGRLIASSLVILLPVLITWLKEGRVYFDSFVLLAMHWLCLLLVFRDRRNAGQSPKALEMIFWIVPTVSLLMGGVHASVRTGGGGTAVLLLFMYFGFGLLFVGVGNYLPKVRRNNTMGIRVKWALENDDNWNATHRFGGKVWVASGLLCMACGMFWDSAAAVLLFIAAVLAAAFVPMLYSYRYYRKQVREGKIEKSRVNPWGAAAGVILALGFAGYMAWALFSGDMEIVYGEASFTVEASGWDDLTIAYRDIESIEYREQDPSDAVSGSRTNGMGNLRVAMGAFENAIYGDYTRYTYNDCDSCVILTVAGETVVLGGRDDAQTRAIYQELTERLAGLTR